MISDTNKKEDEEIQPDVESILESHGEALEAYLKNIYSKEVSPPQNQIKRSYLFGGLLACNLLCLPSLPFLE